MHRHQILVTVAGTVPDPRGETGTFITLLAGSGEQKKRLFFLESGKILLFWSVLGCCGVLLIEIGFGVCGFRLCSYCGYRFCLLLLFLLVFCYFMLFLFVFTIFVFLSPTKCHNCVSHSSFGE